MPVSRDIARDNLLASPLYDDEYDPHIWFEVPLWMEAAKTCADTLIEVDPANADDYRANADGYLAELEALHAYVREQADRVPESKRVLITARCLQLFRPNLRLPGPQFTRHQHSIRGWYGRRVQRLRPFYRYQ